MSVSYLQSIKRLSAADNLGGITSLQVCRAADIESIPEPVNGIIYGEIVFGEGAGWTTWEVTLESANVQSQDRQSREGSFKNNRLPFVVPKDRAGLRHMFEQASEDEFIITYVDASGTRKLLGLLEAPMRFAYNHDTGARFGDRNAYECSFFFEGPNNIFTYNGTADPAPGGAAPAIVRVNGEVIATLAPGESIDFDTPFDFTFQIVGTNTV